MGMVFHGPGFTPARAFRHWVVGDFIEEILEELSAQCLASSLEESLAEAANASEGTRKAKPAQRLEVGLGAPSMTRRTRLCMRM